MDATLWISLLPNLEPIFGGGLALNLAYLNLPQFRFREKISRQANDKVSNAPEAVHQTKWFKLIKSLGHQADPSTTEKVSMALWGKHWGAIYLLFFHKPVDRWLAGFLTVMCAFYLCMGVAHSIDYELYYIEVTTKEEILNELIYGIVGIFWPILMIGAASFCIWRSKEFVNYQMTGLKNDQIEQGQTDIDQATAELDATPQ